MGWRSDGEDKKQDSRDGALVNNTGRKFNHLGTESSVSLTYVKGMENHLRTMRMSFRHGGRLIRITRRRYF